MKREKNYKYQKYQKYIKRDVEESNIHEIIKKVKKLYVDKNKQQIWNIIYEINVIIKLKKL